METIGVALFEELEPIKIDAGAPELGPTATDDQAGRDAADVGGSVPSPLVEVIGSNLDALAWQQLAPGIWNFTIPITPRAAGDLRLIKLEPSQKLPEHRHQGEELILVLRGSYRDGISTYRTGDFAELDDENKHPMIAEQEGCILLIGNESMPGFISQLN
jgi:putative transcriptional regulator